MSEQPKAPQLPPLPQVPATASGAVAAGPASEALEGLTARDLRGYTLVPLSCPTCGAGLAAEGADVVYYCTACRNGYRLGDDERLSPSYGGLTRVEVGFVALPGVRADRYLPFWIVPARLTIHERDAGGAGRILTWISGGDAIALGTPVDCRFVVPAFELPLTATLELVTRYTAALPALGERIGERLTGGLYGPEDAKKLAEWTVIATEAGRSDVLRNLRYDLELGEPGLLGVPFVRRDGRLVDAIFSVAV